MWSRLGRAWFSLCTIRPPARKAPNLLVRHARHDLFDNLLTLAAHDHVDIRAALEQLLDFQVARTPDDGGHFQEVARGVADLLETRPPAGADTVIDSPADQGAEAWDPRISPPQVRTVIRRPALSCWDVPCRWATVPVGRIKIQAQCQNMYISSSAKTGKKQRARVS
jgi:hypothetical protein